MSEMVERVARRLARLYDDGERHWRVHQNEAREILREVRDVPEDIALAGYTLEAQHRSLGGVAGPLDYWRGMIDAALEPAP